MNVVVGAFWVLSGYVAAYVSTELGKQSVRAARSVGRRGRAGVQLWQFHDLRFFALVDCKLRFDNE